MTYPKGGIWPTRPAAPPPGRGQRPAPTAEERRADWHAQRRQCLTASMVAPVLGVPGPAGGPYDVWAYLRYGIGSEETDAMRLGRRLEPVILDLWREHTGRDCVAWPQDRIAGGAPDIWGATLDGLTETASGPAPVEAKAVAWAAGWADGPPAYVQIQLQVQIWTVGAREGWIAALIAGSRFETWRVARHETLIGRARAYCRDWWARHIEAGDPPPIDGSPRTAHLLARLAEPQDEEQAIRLPAVADRLCSELAIARGLAKQTNEYAGERANALRLYLGRHRYGVTPAGRVVAHSAGRLTLPTRLPSHVRPPDPWRD